MEAQFEGLPGSVPLTWVAGVVALRQALARPTFLGALAAALALRCPLFCSACLVPAATSRLSCPAELFSDYSIRELCSVPPILFDFSACPISIAPALSVPVQMFGFALLIGLAGAARRGATADALRSGCRGTRARPGRLLAIPTRHGGAPVPIKPPSPRFFLLSKLKSGHNDSFPSITVALQSDFARLHTPAHLSPLCSADPALVRGEATRFERARRRSGAYTSHPATCPAPSPPGRRSSSPARATQPPPSPPSSWARPTRCWAPETSQPPHGRPFPC